MEELSNNNFKSQDSCKCNNNFEEIQFDDENKHTKTVDNVSHVESYLKEKRILELMHFMLTKVVAEAPDKPVLYLEKLLDDCISFLAYRCTAPTLYDTRHLEAVLKSFDPCQRGRLNGCQVRRLYETLGLEINKNYEEDIITVDTVFEDLKKKQELTLRELLLAGSYKFGSN